MFIGYWCLPILHILKILYSKDWPWSLTQLRVTLVTAVNRTPLPSRPQKVWDYVLSFPTPSPDFPLLPVYSDPKGSSYQHQDQEPSGLYRFGLLCQHQLLVPSHEIGLAESQTFFHYSFNLNGNWANLTAWRYTFHFLPLELHPPTLHLELPSPNFSALSKLTHVFNFNYRAGVKFS